MASLYRNKFRKFSPEICYQTKFKVLEDPKGATSFSTEVQEKRPGRREVHSDL